jgi:predicted nucleotidyltransferase
MYLDRVEDSKPLASVDDRELDEFVIYRCIVGSRAYGLDHEGSDLDKRGIFLPSASLHWSLNGVPEQIEHKETDECYWELRKFILLALKANPNVLECLFTPLVEYAAPVAELMLAERGRFLSKLVYQTYKGYAESQFRKLEQDLRTTGQLKWKHVMHLIRLLISGITVLEEKQVPVRVSGDRDRLMLIRNGGMPWEEVDAWRVALHTRFDKAFESSTLPDVPDYEWANDFLIAARRTMV